MLAKAEYPAEHLDAARSQTSRAYQLIRDDIVAGRRAPGEKLKIQVLAKGLSVSPGAVREALSRLIPEKLVVSQDQRGFHVAPLSIADLKDLTDLRCEIEAIALRRSLERGDVEWEAGLVAAIHRLNATPIRDPGEKAPSAPWVIAHSHFHAALVAAAGNPRLLSLHNQLYQQSERYRGLAAHVESERDVASEHREIAELALARAIDPLIKAITAHFLYTTRLTIEANYKISQHVLADEAAKPAAHSKG